MKSLYKEVSTERERKLKYLGPCSKCEKDTHQRWIGGKLGEINYRCMKCKTVNIEKNRW